MPVAAVSKAATLPAGAAALSVASTLTLTTPDALSFPRYAVTVIGPATALTSVDLTAVVDRRDVESVERPGGLGHAREAARRD